MLRTACGRELRIQSRLDKSLGRADDFIFHDHGNNDGRDQLCLAGSAIATAGPLGGVQRVDAVFDCAGRSRPAAFSNADRTTRLDDSVAGLWRREFESDYATSACGYAHAGGIVQHHGERDERLGDLRDRIYPDCAVTFPNTRIVWADVRVELAITSAN